MSAFSPLTTWLESSSSSMLWGEIHGGGLGDGGRSSGWDWIFGPILQDAEAHVSIQASAEPLRTGQLGTGHASISVQAQGRLLPEVWGRFPLISWLEQGGASLVLPSSQSLGLGDGGFHAWNEWVFGNPISLEGEVQINVFTMAETPRLGLGSGSTSIGLYVTGSLLNPPNCYLDVYNIKQTAKDYTTYTDNNLTLTTDSELGLQYCFTKGTVLHRYGKWYFEITSSSPYVGYGLVKDSIDLFGTGGSDPELSNLAWYSLQRSYLRNGSTIIDIYPDSGSTRFAVAVDLDAHKVWFAEEGVWYWDGDPENGAYPSFTNVEGPVYPTTIHALLAGVTATVNFGETSFVYPAPVGFQSWNELEPYPKGNISLSLEAQGTLSISLSSTWISASTFIDVVTQGTLSFTVSELDTANISLSLTLSGTLSFQSVAFHESSYGTQGLQAHHTSYASETETAQVLHEVSWSNSSFILHESIYRSLLSSFDQTQHIVSWESLGGATQANQLHEVSWASAGSADSARAFHTVTYESWQLTPAFAQHETSWASLGGASSAFQLNAVSWASLGSSSAFNLHETTWRSLGGSTSASHLHETSWQSLGGALSASSFHTISWTWSPAIRRQHDVLWKSIEAHERFHTTAWNSDTSIYRLHEARYRSNTTTPMIIDSLFYVRV